MTKDFSVVFKYGEQLLLDTTGTLKQSRGEPHDTADLFNSALQKFYTAVSKGDVAKDAMKLCDVIVIEGPAGIKTYTDKQIESLLDEVAELNKYKPTKNDHVIVYMAGGITGGMMGEVEQALDVLSDKDFKRVQEILDALQTRRAKHATTGWVGDFGYYVRIGAKDVSFQKMTRVFDGGPFSNTPKIVEELQNILQKYAPAAPGTRKMFNFSGPSGTGS